MTTDPLVAVICRAPIMSLGIEDALDGLATVRSIPARGDDTVGLLRGLDPDAVVVDTDDAAHAAEAFAADSASPVVHVSPASGNVRVLEDGTWREAAETATPAAIRNAVVRQIFGRRKR